MAFKELYTLTSGGSGLSGTTVKIYDVNDNPIEHANTGGNGQFTIANLPVGSYKVTEIKSGYLLPLTIPFSIQSNKTTNVTIDLTADPEINLNVLYGVIRTTLDETPIENAVVNLYSNTTPDPTLVINVLTNDTGQYIFGLIPAGDYYITASKLGYFKSETAIISLTTDEFVSSENSLIVDTLANTGTVSGFIKDLDTTFPIADAGVALYSVSGGIENVIATTRTNISGKYLFTNVNPGTLLNPLNKR